MAESPDPKQSRRTVPAESTPISLHAANCTESPQDLQRMRDLIKEDPSLLYKVQPNPSPFSDPPSPYPDPPSPYSDPPSPYPSPPSPFQPSPYQPSRYQYQPSPSPSPPLLTGPQNNGSDLPGGVWFHDYSDIEWVRERVELSPVNFDTLPLWQACTKQHLSCVKLLLEACGPGNIKLLENLYKDTSGEQHILPILFSHVQEEEKGCRIMELLLQYGISPNMEIPISEILNLEILKVLEHYQATKLIFPSRCLHLAVKHGYSKMVEVLFEHGAYPDPVILTESGSVLPLYPTLGKHLDPIPDIEHPVVEKEKVLAPDLNEVFIYCGGRRGGSLIESIKKLLVHGASVPPYYNKRSNYDIGQHPQIYSHVLLPFDIIRRISDSNRWMSPNDVLNWGERPDGTVYRYYDIILVLLRLYHQFGADLWWKIRCIDVPCEGGKGECLEHARDPNVRPCKDIIDYLTERIEEPEQSMLVGEVQRMMSTPPSLQHSARLAIRRSMGYGCVRNLKALPLPDRLKKYLKFETE